MASLQLPDKFTKEVFRRDMVLKIFCEGQTGPSLRFGWDGRNLGSSRRVDGLSFCVGGSTVPRLRRPYILAMVDVKILRLTAPGQKFAGISSRVPTLL